ncbi:MAG: NAD(P)-dependent oxidoreductase [Gammaproteobacteria bacterium]|nr:NAD(P)-dependent oxidoreductase [Gammaproteobacteria bacterium]
MTGSSALITGASGLVGREVASEFERNGWRVWRVHRHVQPTIPDSVSFDLARDRDLTVALRARPDVIVHLAAAVPHGTLHPDTQEAALAIRRMDAAVCAAARAWDCPVYYASSCGLYRRDDAIPKHESAPLAQSLSPYFAAKAAGEAAMLALDRASAFRLSSPIGRGLRKSTVMAHFVARAREGGDITLYGSGNREQDFVDARDLGRLFVSAATQSACGIFNACSGRHTTMRELAEAVIGYFGRGRIVMTGQPDPNEGHVARYDVTAARKILGWTATFNLMETIANIAEEDFSP